MIQKIASARPPFTHIPWQSFWRECFHRCPGLYRQAMWMKHFGHACLKRTLLWSTSEAVKYLDLGPIKKNQHKSEVKTAHKYQDRSGKTRYKGAGKDLKGTQFPGWEFKHFNYPFFLLLLECWPKSIYPWWTDPGLRLYPPRFVGKILENQKEFLATKPALPPLEVQHSGNLGMLVDNVGVPSTRLSHDIS